jgi:hypothetical protein
MFGPVDDKRLPLQNWSGSVNADSREMLPAMRSRLGYLGCFCLGFKGATNLRENIAANLALLVILAPNRESFLAGNASYIALLEFLRVQ